MKALFYTLSFSFLTIGLFAQTLPDSIYTSSETLVKISNVTIYGSFTIPKNTSSSPVVLIIPGSGPTDRNGNSNSGLQTNAYKMLAEGLAEKGISTLRYDKRGIGQSKGGTKGESELNFETSISDVTAWINLLKADKRFSKIVILGHSEGSLIGIIAAEQNKVAGYISVAGPGKSADKILQEQLKTKLPPQLLSESNAILDSLRKGKTVKNVSQNLMMLYRPTVQPYLISWIKYDPAKEIGKLKMPVLIIQGTTDMQVTVNDAKLLSAAKPDAKLVIIENMNHVLKEVNTDSQKNKATYANPTLPLKIGLMDELVRFIKE